MVKMQRTKFSIVKLILFLFILSPFKAYSVDTAELSYPSEEWNLSSTQDFWWTPVAGAHGYWLSLEDSQGNTYSDYVVYSQSTNNASLSGLPSGPLTASFYTIVLDGNGDQNWDQKVTYYFNAPASNIITPSSNILSGSSQNFAWESISGADYYYLSISDDQGNSYYSESLGLNTQVTVDNLPTDGRTITTTLYTVIGDNWYRNTSRTFTTSSNVTTGTIKTGYDWALPTYANNNPNGGLLRDTWDEDKTYTGFAFYSIRWDEVRLPNGSYDFSSFNSYLNQYSNGDKLLVRLEVNSRCETPNELLGNFNFYAGNSIAFWEQAYRTELADFVNAFSSNYASNPQIIGVHLGIADGEYRIGGQLVDYCTSDYWAGDDGWGEFWMHETELSSAIDQGLLNANIFNTSVTQLIDIYANAFAGYEYKLAFMNFGDFTYDDTDINDLTPTTILSFQNEMPDIVDHSMSKGIGNRDGQIEDWMRYIQPDYGMKFLPGNSSSCYLEMDETFADTIAGRYWGTENEEYGNKPHWIERYGPFNTQNYRFLMSSLRALHMRRNFMTVSTSGLDDLPNTIYRTNNFINYMSRTLGRTKQDTPDVFVMLGERYIDKNYLKRYDDNAGELGNCFNGQYAKIREFGRWLTETGGQGSRSNRILLDSYNTTWSVPDNLPVLGSNPSTKYEFRARRHNDFTFDINDQVVQNRCGGSCDIEVKVVFYDKVATTLSLVNQNGTLSTVQTSGTKKYRTATFTTNTSFSNSYNNADFGIKTSSASEKQPILMVRVNFMNP